MITRFSSRTIIGCLFFLLVAFLPSETRYIWRMGMIHGEAIEAGTISFFGMEFVAIAFSCAVFFTEGWRRLQQLFSQKIVQYGSMVAGFTLLSVLQADDRLASLVNASWVIIGFFVFVAILLFKPDIHKAIATFVGAALFQFGFGASQFLSQKAIASKWLGMAEHSAGQLGTFVIETGSGRWLRAYGTLPHPNMYGLFLAVGLLMTAGLLLLAKENTRAKLYALLPLIAAGLFFSFSRSAFIGAVVGFTWFGFVTLKNKKSSHAHSPFFFICAVIAATFLVFGSLYPNLIATRAIAEGRIEKRSFSERSIAMSDAKKLFHDHFFFGVGIGQMPFAIAREISSVRQGWGYQNVHTMPFLVAVELGVFGFFAWCMFIGSLIAVIIQKKQHYTLEAQVFAAAFFAMLAAGMFDHFLWSSWFGQILFWIIAGLLFATQE